MGEAPARLLADRSASVVVAGFKGEGPTEDARESPGTQDPFPPRPGEPEEYAALAGYVVENGPLNEMLNGKVIRLDGVIRATAR